MFQRALGLWLRRTRRSVARAWSLLTLLGLTAFCLAPAMETGYWAEDIYYSAMIPASPILNDTSWLTETSLAVKTSIQVGRFYPITPIITALAFILFQQVALYKAYIVAVTLLDLLLYHALIRQMSGRKGFAAFATACTVALIQFRLTVDPMLGYYAQIQWVIAAFFLALLWLHRALADRGNGWLVLSALAYFLCTLTYEMTYALVVIPLFLIARARPGWGRGARLASPYLAAAGFSAGMTLLVRGMYPSNNYVHVTDFALTGVLRSLGYQLSASLPLSYYCADPLRLFPQGHDLSRWFDWVVRPRVVVVAVVALGWVYFVFRKADRHSPQGMMPTDKGSLLGLGIGLTIAPTLLIALSPYHRAYLSFGVGWIGVMVQYYGVGLVLGLLGWQFLTRTIAGGPFARWKSLTVAALFAGTLAVTFRANIEVATAFNAPPGSVRFRQFAADHGASWHWNRLNLIAAINAGIFDGVPAGSRVELDNHYPFWHDNLYGQFFYTKQTGHRVETRPSLFPSQLAADAPTFRVRDMVRDREVGLVVVTAVEQPHRETVSGRIFIRHPQLQSHDHAGLLLVLMGGSSGATTAQAQAFRLGQDLPVIRTGVGWGLYACDPEQAAAAERFRIVDDSIPKASWSSLIAPDRTATHPSSKPIQR